MPIRTLRCCSYPAVPASRSTRTLVCNDRVKGKAVIPGMRSTLAFVMRIAGGWQRAARTGQSRVLMSLRLKWASATEFDVRGHKKRDAYRQHDVPGIIAAFRAGQSVRLAPRCYTPYRGVARSGAVTGTGPPLGLCEVSCYGRCVPVWRPGAVIRGQCETAGLAARIPLTCTGDAPSPVARLTQEK